MKPTDALTHLSGVGPALAEKLAAIGLRGLGDLLFHLPLRYEDRTRLIPLSALQAGQHCLTAGLVESSEVVFRRRRSLIVRLGMPDTGRILTLRFFHFHSNQVRGFAPGKYVRCFGEARLGPNGLEMVHPEYRAFEEEDKADEVDEHLLPIYPTTQGVGQTRLRSMMAEVLKLAANDDWFPDLLEPDDFPEFSMSLRQAIEYVHCPPADADVPALIERRHPAQERLAVEELLAWHLALRRHRHRQKTLRGEALALPKPGADQLLASLPFAPTGAQSRVLQSLQDDLSRRQPMMRLVQGDVGCGKTVIAAAAMAATAAAGAQAVLLAPTELLAEQHFLTLNQWFESLGQRVALVTGSMKKSARQPMEADIASGEAKIIVGTHALLQGSVHFKKLALVVVDEQHRFGVEQRLRLTEAYDDPRPHQLIMTATPIPRTLAMAWYADLDVSVIDELPPGRQPVQTIAVEQSRREEVLQRIGHACAQGRQVYWVCTLIEESETLQCRTAEESVAHLKQALPNLRCEVIHGRLKPAEKDRIMHQFRDAKIDILVATTVVEVGVDVPNASLMVIENAERLGLSQLHQLRGRVGRGSELSHCILMYQSPLGEVARERIAVMRETSDGFRIAERDLELRGAGELLGTRQSGMAQFRVARAESAPQMITRLTPVADRLLKTQPQRADELILRWVGDAEKFLRA